MNVVEVVKFIYIYLFSAIGLILVVMGAVRLTDVALKTYAFKQADVYYAPTFYDKDSGLSEEEVQRRNEEFKKAEEINRKAERQRTIASSISLIAVGLPLFLYHWRIARKISFQ